MARLRNHRQLLPSELKVELLVQELQNAIAFSRLSLWARLSAAMPRLGCRTGRASCYSNLFLRCSQRAVSGAAVPTPFSFVAILFVGGVL